MENTSYNPERKEQVNHVWSDVQTTQFEKPATGWGPVQTTKYEKQANNWGPVQTTPLGKGVATTLYEQQRPAWGPVQESRHGPPVVWGASNSEVESEYNMALRHQVFGEFQTQFDLQS
jgi:hypothetical protein